VTEPEDRYFSDGDPWVVVEPVHQHHAAGRDGVLRRSETNMRSR